MTKQIITLSDTALDASYYQSQALILQEELETSQKQVNEYLNKINSYQTENNRLKENLILLKKFNDSLWERLQTKDWI